MSIITNSSNILTQIFNRFHLPKQQNNCQTHSKSNQFVCSQCFIGILCEDCLNNHQCQHKQNKNQNQVNEFSISQHNLQKQGIHFYKFLSQNKQDCLKIINQSKSILNKKMVLNYHVLSTPLKVQQEQCKDININKIIPMIINSITEIQQKQRKQIQHDINKIHKDITQLYQQFQHQTQQQLKNIENLTPRQRTLFKNNLKTNLQKFDKYSTKMNNQYIKDVRDNYGQRLYNAINKKLKQILNIQSITQQSMLSPSIQLIEEFGMKTGKTPKLSKTQKVYEVQISTKQTLSILKLPIEQISKQQQFGMQTQSIQLQQFGLQYNSNEHQQQQNINNSSILSDSQIEDSERIQSLQKIIKKDLQTLTMREKKIKDLQYFLDNEQNKNRQLSKKLIFLKTKMDNNYQSVSQVKVDKPLQFMQQTIQFKQQNVKQTSKSQTTSPKTKNQENLTKTMSPKYNSYGVQIRKSIGQYGVANNTSKNQSIKGFQKKVKNEDKIYKKLIKK